MPIPFHLVRSIAGGAVLKIFDLGTSGGPRLALCFLAVQIADIGAMFADHPSKGGARGGHVFFKLRDP